MKLRPDALHAIEVFPAKGPRVPPDWALVFGRAAPLAVELGFGSGEALTWWAGRRPDWNFVGIEQPTACRARAAARLAAAGREHVRIVGGDARTLLRELFPTGSLRRVLMQFPMPWPKDRHAKHRVSGPGFAATLADVLEPGGRFELVTDQAWFAGELRDALDACGAFRLPALQRNPGRPFRTRYERRWLAAGRSIFRQTAVLERPAPAPRLCLPLPMLTLELDRFPSAAELACLEKARFKNGDRVGEVKELFTNAGGHLVKVVAADDAFSQLFYLHLGRRPEGRGVVRVAEVPRPYFTPAVRELIQAVAGRLGEEPARAGAPPGRSSAGRPPTAGLRRRPG